MTFPLSFLLSQIYAKKGDSTPQYTIHLKRVVNIQLCSIERSFRIRQDVSTPEEKDTREEQQKLGVHVHINCERCGMDPIIGKRYSLVQTPIMRTSRTETSSSKETTGIVAFTPHYYYEVCEACYSKMQEDEQKTYDCIAPDEDMMAAWLERKRTSNTRLHLILFKSVDELFKWAAYMEKRRTLPNDKLFFSWEGPRIDGPRDWNLANKAAVAARKTLFPLVMDYFAEVRPNRTAITPCNPYSSLPIAVHSVATLMARSATYKSRYGPPLRCAPRSSSPSWIDLASAASHSTTCAS